MESPEIVIIGAGTIGEPLATLLAKDRNALGLGNIIISKKTPNPVDGAKVRRLASYGVGLAVAAEDIDRFRAIDQQVVMPLDEALDRAAVVIDCTPSGGGLAHKRDWYIPREHNTRGFIAQGSEEGFGVPFAYGINNSVLNNAGQYIQVVSCNTHALCAIVEALGFDNGHSFLREADFTCLRRANDISQSGSFIPAPQAGRHDDPEFGTHHAHDAWRVFQTLGHDLRLTSSAIKMNSQYMHMVRFKLTLDRPMRREEVIERFMRNERIAVTEKIDAGVIFSHGRDHGHYGRLYSQAVVSLPGLHVHEATHEVTGFAFTPQDGNSLLSSSAAAFWLLDPASCWERLKPLLKHLAEEA